MADFAEFEIVVDDGRTIRSEYFLNRNRQETVPSRPLVLSSVRRRTTEFLIRLLREGRLEKEYEYQILGENLFACLFYEDDGSKLSEVGSKLKDAMREAAQAEPGDERLLRITLDFQGASTELSSWPWEYLYSPDRSGEDECNFFIAQRTRMALTRIVALTNVRSTNPAQPPLKVLLVVPSTRQLPVEASSVVEALEELDAQKRIRLNRLPIATAIDGPRGKVTFRDFKQALGWDPHVIHFIGHGKHEMQGDRAVGNLAFTDEYGEEPRWIGDQQIATTIADNASSLHLVFLQACESADTMSTSSYQTIAGLAQSLTQRSIPAVVAMHYRVPGQIGNALSREFYGQLADSHSVLRALNHARAEVEMDASEHGMFAAVGLPVLYLRGTGIILDSDQRATATGGRSQAAPTNCPWDGEVITNPDGSCLVCSRVLSCPVCQTPRTLKGNLCVRCRVVRFEDAELGTMPTDGERSRTSGESGFDDMTGLARRTRLGSTG